MQPPGQQPQNWMKQWQDHLHKEQMAYGLQQKQSKSTSKAPAKIARRRSAAQRLQPAEVQYDDKFAVVEREVEKLRHDLASGRLAPSQFDAKLEELMVEDSDGNWWMVGASSGEWYRHQGGDWVRAEPPGRTMRQAALSVDELAFTESKSHWFAGMVVLILGAILTFAAGGFAIDMTERGNTADISLPLGLGIWFVGGVLTIIVTRKVWRRR